MAAVSTLATFDAMFKELYQGTVPGDVAEKDHVALKMIPKRGGFTGDNLPVPIMYGHPQGRSRTFTSAQAQATASKSIKFNVTRTQDYGYVTISSEAILASKGSEGSFLEEKKAEVDGMLMEMGDNASRSLYRTKEGVIGQRASISGDIVTLADPTDVRHFSVDMTVGAVATPFGTPTVRNGTTTVASVDPDAGTVTLASAAAISGFANNDYLFVEGDWLKSWYGFAAYLPLTAPTAGDNFWGVDRSVHPTRLAGVRRNKPLEPIAVNIMKVCDEVVTYKGRPNVCFINHRKYTQLQEELQNKATYVTGKIGDVFFTGIKINYSSGSVTVFGDPDCPSDKGYVLTLSSWVIRYLGSAFIHIVDDDGRTSLRLNDDDGIEVRGRQYAQVICNAPGKNGVFALPVETV